MDVPFDIAAVIGAPHGQVGPFVGVINTQLLRGSYGSRICDVLELMGKRSMVAQGLKKPVTDGSPHLLDQRIYMLAEGRVAAVETLGGPHNIVLVSRGGSHSCALDGSGSVSCWGEGRFGQLGSGRWTHSTDPVQVVGLGSAVSASAGGTHSCAVEQHLGLVKCWGQGRHGQLGHGGRTGRSTARPVSLGYTKRAPRGVPEAALLEKAVSVSAGGSHTCALSDRRVYCWGYGEKGQLDVHAQNSALSSCRSETRGGASRRYESPLSHVGQRLLVG